jgi:hypothetical protein
MRWYTALALLLFALVALASAIRRDEPKRVVLNAIEERLESEPRPSAAAAPSPPPASRPAQPPPQTARDRSGVARIKGRVTLPPGEQDADALSELCVSASDGTRVFDGRVTPDGRFAFHLPPGRYTLDASAAQLVGTEPDVIARAGAERDVDILLGPSAAIRGTLRAADDADVSVSARASGRSAGAADAETTGTETFEITGLIPGRKYDLTFRGQELRSVTLREIAAPAAGLQVALDAGAVVRGAVGFPRGERCPISEVMLRLPDDRYRDSGRSDEEEVSSPTEEPGADCRFEIAVPDDVFEATVVATGPGWFLEQHVAIPAHGDPPSLCLNPPCRENPTEGLARLRVQLEGADAASAMGARVSATDGSQTRVQACSGAQGWCEIEDLPTGEAFAIEGHGVGCVGQPKTAVLVSGDNVVSIACRHFRQVEGVIRIGEGAPR